MGRALKVIGLILLVLILDQSSKIWVKTTMEYGEEIRMFGLDWARIHFVENNGMAFGISLEGSYGKLALSLFRIIAVVFLSYYIKKLIDLKASMGLLLSFGLILAGALGNILDSAFYGMFFSASHYHGGVAELFPEAGGYASFLHGKVVDMLYFPMFRGYFPEWFPFWSGEPYLFFRPVFNIADVSITVGVLSIILFQRNFFKSLDEDQTEVSKEEVEPIATIDTASKDSIIETPTEDTVDKKGDTINPDKEV